MNTKPDPVGWPWLRTPAATRLLARLSSPVRPVDLAFPVEVEERAIKERNEAITVQAVRDTLYSADATDPRRI